MSLPRLEYSTHIADRLEELGRKVKARSRANLNDANQILETISKRFFNALFGWELVSLNLDKDNFPAADLGDRQRRIAIQITNQESGEKITRTADKAAKHKLNADFNRLIVFFLLSKKPQFPKKFIQPKAGPRIETWDIADILKQMKEMDDLESLARAAEVLDEEMEKIQPRKRGWGAWQILLMVVLCVIGACKLIDWQNSRSGGLSDQQFTELKEILVSHGEVQSVNLPTLADKNNQTSRPIQRADPLQEWASKQNIPLSTALKERDAWLERVRRQQNNNQLRALAEFLAKNYHASATLYDERASNDLRRLAQLRTSRGSVEMEKPLVRSAVANLASAGDAYFAMKDYGKAADAFGKATRLDPNFAPAYMGQGHSLGWLMDFNGALTNFNEIVRLQPKNADAYFERGYKFYALKDYTNAMGDFRHAIALNPRHADAYRYLGHSKGWLGDYTGAKDEFDKVIALRPDSADAFFDRGYKRYALQDYTNATEDFTEAIRLNPRLADAYRYRGHSFGWIAKAFLLREDGITYRRIIERAIPDFEKVIELRPADAQAYFDLGYKYYGLNDYTNAISNLSQTLLFDTKHAEAWKYRGEARLWTGDREGHSDLDKANALLQME